jgi:hypothetical protein
VDPEPGSMKLYQDRVRPNRFRSREYDGKLCELCTPAGKFNPALPYSNLEVSLKDLVGYWWNNLVDQDDFIYGVMDDILTVHKDRLLPKPKPEPVMDYSHALDGVMAEVAER